MNILKKLKYRFKKLPKVITIGEKYNPAMKITDPEEAKAYFELCVQHCMKYSDKPMDREEAERIQSANIGYYAGYYDRETGRRVQKLFGVVHPIFGKVDDYPTPERAFVMGQAMGEKLKKDNKGQALILFAAFLLITLAAAAFVLDGGAYVMHWQSLQVDLDIACVAAGTLGEGAFQPSLDANSVIETAYLYNAPDYTYIAEAGGDHEFYLAQFMGIRSMNVSTETRCLRAKSGILPIAVQESWYLESHENGNEYSILGDGVEAEYAPDHSFSGALYSHIWCADGADCESRQYHEPVTEEQATSSCQPDKDIVEENMEGSIEPVYIPVGTTVPHVSGVSNNKLVKALKRGGWQIGDHLYV
ncbi:hypothetical protein LCGC14_2707400, partial [marine sediment metagenome]